MRQLATCRCSTAKTNCDRLATQEDLLCDVCREGCIDCIDATADDPEKWNIWWHQNDDTIQARIDEMQSRNGDDP